MFTKVSWLKEQGESKKKKLGQICAYLEHEGRNLNVSASESFLSLTEKTAALAY